MCRNRFSSLQVHEETKHSKHLCAMMHSNVRCLHTSLPSSLCVPLQILCDMCCYVIWAPPTPPTPPTLTRSSRWLYRCTLRMWLRTGSFSSSMTLWVTTAGSCSRCRGGEGREGRERGREESGDSRALLTTPPTHSWCYTHLRGKDASL